MGVRHNNPVISKAVEGCSEITRQVEGCFRRTKHLLVVAPVDCLVVAIRCVFFPVFSRSHFPFADTYLPFLAGVIELWN